MSPETDVGGPQDSVPWTIRRDVRMGPLLTRWSVPGAPAVRARPRPRSNIAVKLTSEAQVGALRALLFRFACSLTRALGGFFGPA